VLRITLELSLSTCRMVRVVFFFKVRNAFLSALVKISPGLEELVIILMVSGLASSEIATGSD